MRSLKMILADFCADDSGATSIEYALIAGGIALAILASINAIGSAINLTFGRATTAIQ
jgi:pilus assembly protein Flp/PilA